MKKNTIYTLALSFAIMFGTGFFVPEQAQAQYSDTPFGGRMTQVIFNCQCEPCRLVSIGGPRGGTFMFCAGFRLYDHRAPYPQRWQLGMAGSSRTCHRLVCTNAGCKCVSNGSGLQVIMDGTSMY